MSRYHLTIVALVCSTLAVAACGGGATQPVITVYHRCGDLNFEALSGHYGRLEGSTGVNSRFRVLFTQAGAGVEARWVGGNAERFLLKGLPTSSEQMTFDEVGDPADPSGRARRIKASLTTDCRLQLDHFGVRNGQEVPVPAADGLNQFASYPELERLDFEPCTEPLYIRGAAKSRSKATGGTIRPATPPTVKEDRLPVGSWSSAGELNSGCRGAIDLYVDGEADAIDAPAKDPSGGHVQWYLDYETNYLGVHHLAMHRKAVCGEQTTLLGVACTEIEVQ